MTTKYLYRNWVVDTEAEAQAKLSETKTRLDNNPTDWCMVKCVEPVADDTFSVIAGELTDEQILNPDNTKTYIFYAKWTGENFFPLTSTELTEKVFEYRRGYVTAENLSVIKSYEDREWTEADLEAVKPPEDGSVPTKHVEMEMTDITPNEDMSGYI
jgi:hypothetical protein